MKKNSTLKKSLCIISCFLILCQLLLLVSCNKVIINEEQSKIAEDSTKMLLDYLIADKFDESYAMFDKYIQVSNYAIGYAELRATIVDKKIETYTLEQIGWYKGSKNGTGYYSITFHLKSDSNTELYLESTFLTDNNDFVSFTITDPDDFPVPQATPLAAELFFWALTLLSTAFTIRMIVDCIKRPIAEKKILWIIVILFGFMLTLTFSTGLNLNFNIGIIFFRSQLALTTKTTVVRIAVPLGALLYFFKRKSLTVLPKKVDDGENQNFVTGEVPSGDDQNISE